MQRCRTNDVIIGLLSMLLCTLRIASKGLKVRQNVTRPDQPGVIRIASADRVLGNVFRPKTVSYKYTLAVVFEVCSSTQQVIMMTRWRKTEWVVHVLEMRKVATAHQHY
jgi:hypothetical protein